MTGICSPVDYQAVVDSMQEGFALLATIRNAAGDAVDFRFVAANQACMAQIGLKDELIGKTMQEVAPAWNPAIIAHYERLMRGESPLDFEHQLPGSGRHLWVRAFRTSTGMIATIFEDVTERTLAGRALQKSEERYKLLFGSINDAILVHPFHEDLTPEPFEEVNDVACDRLGYSREEMLRMSAQDIDAPEGLPLIPEVMARLRGEGHAVWEGVHRHKSGQKIPVEISNRLFEMDGKPMILATIRDITERKRTDRALKESEERYRQLVELCPDSILVHREGKIAFVNSSALDLFGAPEAGALLGRNVQDFVHPDFRELVRERTRIIQMEGGSVPRQEQKCLRLDGTAFDAEVSSAPILYEGVRSSLTMIRDVSERKRAEHKLHRRVEEMTAFQSTLLEITTPHELSRLLEIIVERAANLLNAEGGGLYLCDPKQRVARCAVSHNTPVDYVGTILKYGEGASGVVAETGKALLINDYTAWPGRADSFEADSPFRAVASVPLLWQGQVTGVIHALKYGQGDSFSEADLELLSLFANHAAIAVENARLFNGLERELSERKKMEGERETALQRLEFVLGATKTGLDIIDASYTVQYVDQMRKNALGEYSGRKCYEYFRSETGPCGGCAMLQALATHEVAVAEQTSVDGRPIQVTAMPYQTATGNWMVADVTVDITDRKQAEVERLELERRILSAQKLEGLGILAGGIAHNFNNFLTVILGYADLLRDTQPGETDFKAAVQEIINAGLRSRDMIGQLLAMGRRQRISLVPTDLNEILAGSHAILRQAIRENVDLEFRLAPFACPVMADAGLIEQVLLNLALNSQDAIPRDGTVTFATSEIALDEATARRHENGAPGRYVLISVSDTGVGMDPQTKERIFDPFFTTKEQGKGTGLGLSTVYGIVKQHGGSIEVESEPGKGTRFVVLLPRTDVPLHPTEDAGFQKERVGNETLLLVEDQDSVRALVSQQLRNLGYTVLEAPDGPTALRKAVGHRGDLKLLLTDVILAGMNGRELYERLSCEHEKMKVLYMSGYAKDVLANHGVPQAEAGFLQKPFDSKTLAAKVREVLEKP
jgi:PAS domain S-box-containing protein